MHRLLGEVNLDHGATNPITYASFTSHPGQVTTIIERAAAGDHDAFRQLYELVYDELHRIAHRERIRWHGNETLNTTALVHEAYLKLVRQDPGRWEGREHFLAVAARAMRHVLVNYAERQRAQKRGGQAETVALDEAREAGEPAPFARETADEILALEEALARLEGTEERQARVVECRFFLGLPVEDTARVLGISPATVKRDWKAASAWLYEQVRGAR